MRKKIFIINDGTLKRKSNTLLFNRIDGKNFFIPIKDVNSLFAFGELNLNKRTLEFLAKNDISLHFYSRFGFYVGSFIPKRHYNAGIITLKQAEFYLHSQKRLSLAKKFVEGALKNMMVVLNYYKNRQVELTYEIESLNSFLVKANLAENVEQLMGIEGNAKEVYYYSFNKIIKDDAYHYTGRSRKPPLTKLNSLISFGNSLLYAIILSEIYKTRLDPRIGYLHSTNGRKFSLNLDISELFKPLIVDRVLFTLINKEMLDTNDFIKHLNGLFLSESGKKKFLAEMERHLTSTIKHKTLNREITYQSLIRMELYKLEKHLIQDEEYMPFVMWW